MKNHTAGYINAAMRGFNLRHLVKLEESLGREWIKRRSATLLGPQTLNVWFLRYLESSAIFGKVVFFVNVHQCFTKVWPRGQFVLQEIGDKKFQCLLLFLLLIHSVSEAHAVRYGC